MREWHRSFELLVCDRKVILIENSSCLCKRKSSVNANDGCNDLCDDVLVYVVWNLHESLGVSEFVDEEV